MRLIPNPFAAATFTWILTAFGATAISATPTPATADPFRWLEEVRSDKTRTWIEQQDRAARRYVEKLPMYEAGVERQKALMNLDAIGVPIERGDGDRRRVFFTRGQLADPATGLWVEEGGRDRLLIDPTSFEAPPGETLRLAGWVPSPDGRLVAYGIARLGSGWSRWRVRDVATGNDLPDELGGLRGGNLVWTPDGSGLYYGAYDEPPAGKELETVLSEQTVRFHRLGSQATDRIVHREEGWTAGLSVSDDDRFLVLTSRPGADPRSHIRLIAFGDEKIKAQTLVNEDAFYRFVGNDGDTFWLQTDHRAPHSRVVARSRATGRERVVIPEAESATLTRVDLVADRLLALYAVDALPRLRIFDLEGTQQRDLALPQNATTFSGFRGRRSDRTAYFSATSVALPGIAHRLDPVSGEIATFRQPKLPFDPADFVLEQRFYENREGLRVPIFLAHHVDFPLDRPRPVLMYGYGAFGWSAFPWFRPKVLGWLETGGIYALPGIRGGGEYGDGWHQAGIGRHKQRGINDFLDAAEWLIEQKLTQADRLAADGGSASGVLAAAAVVQRPELFAGALVDVPISEMLRFPEMTGGARWTAEFGSPDDPADRAALLAYSPQHNLEKGTCYPPVHIVAGEQDEIAMPAHAYKLAAAMQEAQGCDQPILLRVAWDAGHTVGSTPERKQKAWAAQIAFLRRHLNFTSAQSEGAAAAEAAR
ncbi:MAG: prolyl oligopeptidase family serine peptidase [Acidobacteriota bacterium]